MQAFQRLYLLFAILSLGLLAIIFAAEWINRSVLIHKVLEQRTSAYTTTATGTYPRRRFVSTREYILNIEEKRNQQYQELAKQLHINQPATATANVETQTQTEEHPQLQRFPKPSRKEKSSSVARSAGKRGSSSPGKDAPLEERRAFCSKQRSWAACIKYGDCAWKKIPNREYCEYDQPYELPSMTKEEYDPAFDYVFDPADDRKYFVYQTSGGFNNQRILFENALIVCQLLNRTCVAPPSAPHTNYFQKYNIQPGNKLTSMQRVLNFPELKKIVDVVAVPQGQSFMDWLNQRKAEEDGPWKYIFRDYKNFPPGRMPKWTEAGVKRRFGQFKQKFLFFQNTTMWSAFDWKGSMAGWKQKLRVHKHLMYNNVLKRTARKLSESLGINGAHNAIHVRRGDKTTESNFKKVSHPPYWYLERMVPFKDKVPALYIATDEKNRDFFGNFKVHGFNVTFWEDLDQEILIPFLKRYPARMFMDILSVIEQLLCTYAIKFLGSGYSTLTTFILRMRKRRTVIGHDTELGPELGLPYYARTTNSTYIWTHLMRRSNSVPNLVCSAARSQGRSETSNVILKCTEGELAGDVVCRRFCAKTERIVPLAV